MVKVGILGADNKISGELIRILIHHPETELVNLYSTKYIGKNVSSIHHGLIGESPMFFTDKVNLEEIDYLIITEKSEIAEKILISKNELKKLKIAILNNVYPDNQLLDFEVGISEINRKKLVRETQFSYVPSPAIVGSLIALNPLANYLLLNSDIEIEVVMPMEISLDIDEIKEAERLKNILKHRQISYISNVSMKIKGIYETTRGIKTRITLKNSLAIEEIIKIYQEIYDDHNFTFIITNPIATKEVEGTHKIIISIEKPAPDSLILDIVSDGRLRGGAGDVVHLLNLFFGLHEKTGLQLKNSEY